MESSYDILVIGGGPAGSLAAKTAAEAGCSVLLVEKRPAIGVPIRCAEGIVRRDFEEFFIADKPWISAEIHKAVFTGPDGRAVTVTAKSGETVGYVLNRKVFDKELAWQAGEAGATVIVHALAEPMMEGGKLTGAYITYRGEKKAVSAKVIIACDGVESSFSRAAGIDTSLPLSDIDSCVQYYVTGIDWDETANGFWFSRTNAPEGYIWVFSKGKGRANIGIGIPGSASEKGCRAKDLLDRFMETHFPDAVVLESIAGGVPVSKPLKCTVDDNLLIAGDAARVSDPLTGGGLYSAFVTGTLAGKYAAEAVASGDTSKHALMAYDDAWRQTRMGKEIIRDHHLMTIYRKMDDVVLSRALHHLNDMEIDEVTLINVVKAAFKEHFPHF